MTTCSFKKSCAIVIATKDRTDELKNLLINLGDQSRLPDEVVIVDSSPSPDVSLDSMKAKLSISYIHHLIPSAAVQRNVGIQAISPDIDFVGILDDDVELEADALENMMRFWETASDEVAGCGFNWINFEATPAKRLKDSVFSRRLGLYDTRGGQVMPSGWQTLIGTVTENIFVDWLPIGASFWRRNIFDTYEFDAFFDGYSYLEDLDFTYGVSKKYRLAVVQSAGFCHYHSETSRIDQYRFGKIEVRNRLYFVKKHGLSLCSCYLGIFARLLLSFHAFVSRRKKDDLLRVTGNLSALVDSIMKKKRPVSGKFVSIEKSTIAR